jgi:hypothetical protein
MHVFQIILPEKDHHHLAIRCHYHPIITDVTLVIVLQARI